jgi:hypothetical protein
LRTFFKENIDDLQTDFWKNMSIRDAILKTIDEAEDFEDMITDIEHGVAWNGKNQYETNFSAP